MRNPMSYTTFKSEYEDSISEDRFEDESFEEAADRLYTIYEDSWVDLL